MRMYVTINCFADGSHVSDSIDKVFQSGRMLFQKGASGK